MKKTFNFILLLSTVSILFASCKFYSFTGADIDYNTTKTFQVNYFRNEAPLVEPSISRDFTDALQTLMLNQTSLSQTNAGGDLIFEGEIVEYYVAPITATAEHRAAQNRLTIAVNVRFINTVNPEKDFERRFSHYFDYEGGAMLVGGQLSTATEEIFERITQDIFNASLANW